jgi:protocatechuate 3,4-dioxygenase beta subunit
MDGRTDGCSSRSVPDDFAARLAAAGDGPLAALVGTAVAHLHRLVADTRPTPEDLRRVLDFLTEVGLACDSRRQEWVLLADVLGISTAVEDIATRRPAAATPNTIAGPFYRPDAPEIAPGGTISRDGRGEPVAVAGRIADTAGAPVGGALVEVWQASHEGLYENQEPDRQPEFNLRGRLRSDGAGRFAFRTIRPRGYALPGDGPVGRLLAALGLPLDRPAHLHFRIAAPGFQTLTTHVFDRDDPAIGRDAIFGVKPGLLGAFRPAPPGSEARWMLDVAFVLARDGETD